MEILAILGIFALIILFVLIVYILYILQSTLRKLDIILTDAKFKLKKLSSIFNSVENVGEIAENETQKLRNQYTFKKLNEGSADSKNELASWLISSINLGIKLFKRR